MQTIMRRISEEGRAFLAQVGKSDERLFWGLFLCYYSSCTLFQLAWTADARPVVWKVYLGLFTIVIWGSAVWLFSLITAWRKLRDRPGSMLLTGGILFALTVVLSRLVTTDSYMFAMGAFFCVAVCGKDYRKILKCYLFAMLLLLCAAFLLMLCGITNDVAKPYRVYGGHSLGIMYPNNWGYLVFGIMILVWYLFLRKKKLLTVVLFWSAAAFMYKYITCLTIAGLSGLFPLAAIAAEALEDRAAGDAADGRRRTGAVRIVVILLPFLALALMLLLCAQMDRIHDLFYETRLESFAMRFVEGGYALRLEGITLFGRPFSQMRSSMVAYPDDILMIVDSALIAYLIIRGVLAEALTLGWLALAHAKCLRQRDLRLLTISVFMLVFSYMERPGMDVWYNFILLYPLAASCRAMTKTE